MYRKLYGVNMLICIFLLSCSTDANQSRSELDNEQSFPTKPSLSVSSLSESQAKSRMNTFLKQNASFYKEYGQIEDIYLIGGHYNQDGALDYFYTIDFYPGGDFIYPSHFFYDSEVDQIKELTISKTIEAVRSLDVKEIVAGKLIGEAFIWGAFSGEHVASRSVKAEFSIEGNKLTCDKKYFAAFKKAQKEIEKELQKMEREMMEEADAYNSEE
jgi:hypothetical protein